MGSIKVSSAKAKGRNFQYWVCEKVCKLFNIEFNQSDDLCPIHSREMGQKGTDLVIRDRRIAELFPYDIECKNTQNVSIYAYIKQAEANTKPGNNWLIFHKKNHTKPIVIMDAEHFFQLMDKILNDNKA